MYQLAKIKISAYDELSYFEFFPTSKKLKELPLLRAHLFNRRIAVSPEERKTGIFNDTGEYGLVERYLIADGLKFIQAHNIMTDEISYYKYNLFTNTFEKMDSNLSKKEVKKQIMQENKKLTALSNLIDSINVPTLGLYNTHYFIMNNHYLYPIDYIKTSDKVFYLSENNWVELEPENIFYYIQGIHNRMAKSYLPLPQGTFIKVVSIEYKPNNVQEEVTNFYYLDNEICNKVTGNIVNNNKVVPFVLDDISFIHNKHEIEVA